MPFVKPQEREELSNWLYDNDKAPIDKDFWVSESSYSDFLLERARIVNSAEESEIVYKVSDSSIEVGIRVEVMIWPHPTTVKGKVVHKGAVGFDVELDEPLVNSEPPYTLNKIVITYGNKYRDLPE